METMQLQYCAEVLRFRKVLNLTSIHEQDVFYTRFIQPSIDLGQWIPQGAKVLDIGSGMGVPGIPLLIDRQDITGVLVERRKKRTEFIRHVVRKLQLPADVYDADIFDLPPLQATVCVARAVSDIPTLLHMCHQHIVVGGLAVLPIPDDVNIPSIEGWKVVKSDILQKHQRVVCYEKVGCTMGGVSRET